MNNKQLIKVIKTLVEVETAKQQERFLSKTFPKILEEEVKKRLAEVKGGVVSVPSTQVPELVNEVDPFEQAELALQEQRQTPKKQFTKNAVLNEVLNNTKAHKYLRRIFNFGHENRQNFEVDFRHKQAWAVYHKCRYYLIRP